MLDRNSSIRGTRFVHFADLPCIEFNDCRQAYILFVFHKAGSFLPNSPSWITEQKHGVLFVGPLRCDADHTFRMIRYVVGRILGRCSIRCRVGSHEREIARVSRPFPIVNFATKGTHRNRWCENQPDVFQVRIQEQTVSLARKHFGNFRAKPFVLLFTCQFNLFATLVDRLRSL